MKKAALLLVLLSGCGYSSVHNELSGQAKKVMNRTPLICDNRVDADISLGVMRNGVGSMSTQDVWLTVPNKADQDTLNAAAAAGAIVKVTYDVKRVTFCWQQDIVTSVQIIQ